MSSPYIQVELDALKKAPLLASVLGIQLREAIGGLTMMWAHAYSHKADEVSGLYIRAFFGVDAGPALAEMGFVEHVSDATWRVRGAGRYRRLNEVRSEAGRKGGQASAQAKAASKQAIAQAKGQANEGKQSQATAEAIAKQNPQASKQVLKQNRESAKQNQALEPITEGNPLRDYPSGHEASAREPSAVDALTQPPAGAGGGGAESSDPFRPQAFGEAWHDFAMRYPWPDVPTLSLIEPDARTALFRQAASEKRPPIVLLSELVTERQRYAVGAGGVH